MEFSRCISDKSSGFVVVTPVCAENQEKIAHEASPRSSNMAHCGLHVYNNQDERASEFACVYDIVEAVRTSLVFLDRFASHNRGVECGDGNGDTKDMRSDFRISA
jgi:hypothetical protein